MRVKVCCCEMTDTGYHCYPARTKVRELLGDSEVLFAQIKRWKTPGASRLQDMTLTTSRPNIQPDDNLWR
jgi:hypothetical protein